jgi:hypothetical protein
MQMRRAFFPLICKQSTHTVSLFMCMIYGALMFLLLTFTGNVHAAVISSCVRCRFCIFCNTLGRSCCKATCERVLNFGRAHISLYSYRDVKFSPLNVICMNASFGFLTHISCKIRVMKSIGSILLSSK